LTQQAGKRGERGHEIDRSGHEDRHEKGGERKAGDGRKVGDALRAHVFSLYISHFLSQSLSLTLPCLHTGCPLQQAGYRRSQRDPKRRKRFGSESEEEELEEDQDTDVEAEEFWLEGERDKKKGKDNKKGKAGRPRNS
jgi:hypothetical protein